MRQGTLASLYRATNAIILGDRLAEKIGARVGSNITRAGSRGRPHQRAGGRHCSTPACAQSTRAPAYVLVKTAQILAQQTGLVNELRVRVDRSDGGARRRAAHRARRPATSRCPGRRRTRTCCRAFVIRNIIMYTVVGAILLVASFGTYNIISTITHEKTRDIAIMKSLGLARAHRAPHLRAGGADDRADRRARAAGCSAIS